jgi:uncharacterized protein YcfJ
MINIRVYHRRLRQLAVPACIAISVVGGCATKGRSGAAIGGGLGGIIGQAAGRDTESTLIGAAVGTGIGYIIGNEADKKEAREMEARGYSYHRSTPLSGTTWKVISLVADKQPAYDTIVVEFRRNGRVITTKTEPGGKVIRYDERYRVVGETLIINKPGYLINATYRIDGDDLIVDAEQLRAVLRRL